MITVDQKEIIRREYFLNRKSMREIDKELHHSRKTIRKAIYDPGVPEYKRSVPAPKRAIGPFVEIIQLKTWYNYWGQVTDQPDLLDWVRAFHERPEKIFVVHGESAGAEALATKLRNGLGYRNVMVPDLGKTVEI